MPTAIKKIVTVGAGGIVELRSAELHEGDRAEVTIVVTHPAKGNTEAAVSGRWQRHAGALHSGDARSADNDRIDADLAAEYGNESKAKL